MKIITLIENTGTGELCCEHGLSFYIEYRGKTYLLDSGSTDAFAENAKKLDISLEKIDRAFLSHAHYDHSGGFSTFFALNSEAAVYLREEAKELCFSISRGAERYIGIPDKLLETYPERFSFLNQDIQVDQGVWLIGHKSKGLTERGFRAGMYRKSQRGMCTDDFSHEQSLVFETQRGLVLLNSCSHGGIDVIIEEVMETFPKRQVYAVIGGFHLKGSDGIQSMSYIKEEVEELGEKILSYGVQDIYTGHCTGEPAYDILKEICGEHLHHLRTGTVIEY